MSTVLDLQAKIEEATTTAAANALTLDALDSKLDEIKAFILSLQVGQPVSQEQLDSAVASLTQANQLIVANKTKSEAVLAESDALDD